MGKKFDVLHSTREIKGEKVVISYTVTDVPLAHLKQKGITEPEEFAHAVFPVNMLVTKEEAEKAAKKYCAYLQSIADVAATGEKMIPIKQP